MNRVRELAVTPLVNVQRFDHPGEEEHVDPREEEATGFAVNFVERGSFRIFVGRTSWELTPEMLFVSAPGLVYRCEHPPGPAEDSCLTFSFKDAARDDLLDARAWPALHGRPVIPLDNRRAYAKERLLSRLGASTLELDAVAGEILAATVAEPGARRSLYRPSQLAWYARRVDRARERLNAEYARDHALASLAREAGMSPFHFARVFRELVGIPPHRYLVRRRLEAASKLLRDGLSVSDTCHAVGFSNLSHFVRSFRSRYGRSPSRLA